MGRCGRRGGVTMLAKVMASRRDGGSSFAELSRYVAKTRAGAEPELAVRGIDLGAVDREEALETVIAALDAAASLSKRCRRPLYHFSLNWPDGETPTAAQAFAAADAARAALGMADHQALYALHRDKAHHHVHAVLNRVHPQTGRAVSPRRDYLTLDRVCREIELAQGWRHTPGPHVVVGLSECASVQSVASAVEPAASGVRVIRQYPVRDPERPAPRAPGAAAHDARRGPDEPSFQRWLQATPAAALAACFARPDSSWAELHAVLADLGVVVMPAGSGYLLQDKASGMTAKLSQVRRGFAQAVKAYGPFVPRDPARPCAPRPPTYTFPSPGRARAAGERAEARAALRARYERDRTADRAGRQQARRQALARLKVRQESERRGLQRALQAERRSLTRIHPARSIALQVARAVTAMAAAKAREQLRLRHREERTPLHRRYRSPGLDWRAWLERAADAGDTAAARALRGMRYQTGRAAAIQAATLGYTEPLRPVSVLAGVAWRWAAGAVRYTRGSADFAEDRGARLVVLRTEDDDLRAALLVARERYVGPLTLTGSRAFRLRTAQLAAELGVALSPADRAWTGLADRGGRDPDDRAGGPVSPDPDRVICPAEIPVPPSVHTDGPRRARRDPSTEESPARRYLVSRGLSPRTLALFGDGIGEDACGSVFFRQWAVGDDGALAVCGEEVNPSQSSGLAAGRHPGIGIFVRHPGQTGDITRLVVTAASLDALAKAQLDGHRTDTAYLSLGDAPGPRTFAALDAVRATLGPQVQTLVLALDRDEARRRLGEDPQDRYRSTLRIECDPPPRGKSWSDILQTRIAEERERARGVSQESGRGIGD
ncbi:MAG: TraI/MobA(P) family conjugative relaxase [Acidiferrobacterales bacterium]